MVVDQINRLRDTATYARGSPRMEVHANSIRDCHRYLGCTSTYGEEQEVPLDLSIKSPKRKASPLPASEPSNNKGCDTKAESSPSDGASSGSDAERHQPSARRDTDSPPSYRHQLLVSPAAVRLFGGYFCASSRIHRLNNNNNATRSSYLPAKPSPLTSSLPKAASKLAPSSPSHSLSEQPKVCNSKLSDSDPVPVAVKRELDEDEDVKPVKKERPRLKIRQDLLSIKTEPADPEASPSLTPPVSTPSPVSTPPPASISPVSTPPTSTSPLPIPPASASPLPTTPPVEVDTARGYIVEADLTELMAPYLKSMPEQPPARSSRGGPSEANKKYTCTLCDMKVLSFMKGINHVEAKHVDCIQYKCSICKSVKSTRQAFDHHCRSRHGYEGTKRNKKGNKPEPILRLKCKFYIKGQSGVDKKGNKQGSSKPGIPAVQANHTKSSYDLQFVTFLRSQLNVQRAVNPTMGEQTLPSPVVPVLQQAMTPLWSGATIPGSPVPVSQACANPATLPGGEDKEVLAEWMQQDKGIFKINNQEEFAQLWFTEKGDSNGSWDRLHSEVLNIFIEKKILKPLVDDCSVFQVFCIRQLLK